MYGGDKGLNNLGVVFAVLFTSILAAIVDTVLLPFRIVVGLFTADGM